MRRSRGRHGLLRIAPAAIAIALIASPAAAGPADREACARAAEDGQQSRDDGKLRAARDHFRTCARDVCPAPIRRDCVGWLADVEGMTPTVVFTAKDGDRDVVDVTVFVDDAAVTSRLDGRPMALDVGEHVVRFEHVDASGTRRVKEERILLPSGQKARQVAIRFDPPAPAAPPPPAPAAPPPAPDTRGSLAPAVLVGGLGVVALGSAVVFWAGGRSDVDDLERCKGTCAQDDVDRARTKLILGDVTGGVGILALGLATYMVLTRPAAPSARAHAGPRFDAGPIAGGAAAKVGVSF